MVHLTLVDSRIMKDLALYYFCVTNHLLTVYWFAVGRRINRSIPVGIFKELMLGVLHRFSVLFSRKFEEIIPVVHIFILLYIAKFFTQFA